MRKLLASLLLAGTIGFTAACSTEAPDLPVKTVTVSTAPTTQPPQLPSQVLPVRLSRAERNTAWGLWLYIQDKGDPALFCQDLLARGAQAVQDVWTGSFTKDALGNEIDYLPQIQAEKYARYILEVECKKAGYVE